MIPIKLGSLRGTPAGLLADEAIRVANKVGGLCAVTMRGYVVWVESPEYPERDVVITYTSQSDPDLIAENIAWQGKQNLRVRS